MQVKAKIFPYPVLNHNEGLSNFSGDFALIFDYIDDDENIILQNLTFNFTSISFSQLFKEDKIKIALIIECSYTVFREIYYIDKNKKEILLKKSDFAGDVFISMYAYATCDFEFSPNDVDEDYRDIVFNIEKYDILGINDGYKFRIEHQTNEDNLISSIFSIIPNKKMEDGYYQVDIDRGTKIVICLSENDYKKYRDMHCITSLKEIFFNVILIPALCEALHKCKLLIMENNSDLDDLINTYSWLRSIIEAYNKINSTKLTVDILKEVSITDVAQNLLGKPFGTSINNLIKLTNKSLEDE